MWRRSNPDNGQWVGKALQESDGNGRRRLRERRGNPDSGQWVGAGSTCKLRVVTWRSLLKMIEADAVAVYIGERDVRLALA
jgi:hypothetical protein